MLSHGAFFRDFLSVGCHFCRLLGGDLTRSSLRLLTKCSLSFGTVKMPMDEELLEVLLSKVSLYHSNYRLTMGPYRRVFIT